MKPTLLFVLIFAGVAAFGQENLNDFMTEHSPEQRAQFQTDYMKENLSLTDDQVAKIQGINLKYAEKMQEAYEAPTKKLQKQKALQRINAEKEGELKLTLSPDQYTTYEKNKEAMKKKIKERAAEKSEQ